MKKLQNRIRLELFEKHNTENTIQQSKTTFNGTHKSYGNCDSFAFKRNEIIMDEPNYLVFAILEVSELHIYETYYDKSRRYFGQENSQLHYIDTDAFVLNLNTEDIMKDLKNLEHIFDFNNLHENHELFSKKIKNDW